MSLIAGAMALGALASAGISAYSTWKTQQNALRDFDYQKALQNDIFNREDNAVQRRMDDLESAGLNPNLAAGSAAGAGAVVGRSNTPAWENNSVGAALDMAQHVQQLRSQRTQNQILQNEKIKSAAEAKIAQSNQKFNSIQNTYDELALLYQLGLTSNTKLKVRDGNFYVYADVGDDGDYSISNTPLQNILDWQWQNNKNSADLLQRDVDWYTSDKVADYLGIGARIFSGAGTGLQSFGRWNKYYK